MIIVFTVTSRFGYPEIAWETALKIFSFFLFYASLLGSVSFFNISLLILSLVVIAFDDV